MVLGSKQRRKPNRGQTDCGTLEMSISQWTYVHGTNQTLCGLEIGGAMIHKKYFELLEQQEQFLNRKNKKAISITVFMTVMNIRF